MEEQKQTKANAVDMAIENIKRCLASGAYTKAYVRHQLGVIESACLRNMPIEPFETVEEMWEARAKIDAYLKTI